MINNVLLKIGVLEEYLMSFCFFSNNLQSVFLNWDNFCFQK